MRNVITRRALGREAVVVRDASLMLRGNSVSLSFNLLTPVW
jgi:hypothetical protein